jgi:hypothetical protein
MNGHKDCAQKSVQRAALEGPKPGSSVNGPAAKRALRLPSDQSGRGDKRLFQPRASLLGEQRTKPARSRKAFHLHASLLQNAC